MNCPLCNVPLSLADRQGVEIDYCPKCRGVWLDRGEIDKIIEREAALLGSRGATATPRRADNPPLHHDDPFYRDTRYERHDDDHHARHRDDYGRHDAGRRKKRKRESFLEELFDFG